MIRSTILASTFCCSLVLGAAALTLPSQADIRDRGCEAREASNLRIDRSCLSTVSFVRDQRRNERFSFPVNGDVFSSRNARR